MAQIKYDVSDVEDGPGTGEQAKPGVYPGTLRSIEPRTAKRDGTPVNDLEVVFDFEEDGIASIWSYVGLDASQDWKLKEFVRALGKPLKGSVDTVKDKGKKIKIKVNADSYNGEYRARVGRWIPYDASDNGDGDEPAADEPPSEPTAEVEDDYDEWTVEELKEEAEKRGIIGNISGRKTGEKLIEALRADDAGPAGGEQPEDGEEQEPTDDYPEWTVEELYDEIKTRELEAPKGRKSIDKAIEVLRADDKENPF